MTTHQSASIRLLSGPCVLLRIAVPLTPDGECAALPDNGGQRLPAMMGKHLLAPVPTRLLLREAREGRN